ADLTASLQAVEVPDFYPEFDLAGKIDGTLHVTDTITAPEAALSIDATDLAYDETRIGDLTAAMSLSNGTAVIDALSLSSGQSLVRLTGTVDVFTPGSLSLLPVPALALAFEESNIYIGDFMDPACGRITFHGRAAGEINDLEADFSLTGTDLEAAGYIIGDMEARLGLARGRLSLTPLEIVNNRSKLALTGNIDLFTPDTLDLHEDPAIDLKIAADEMYVDDFLEAMSGRLSLSGKVNGSIGNPKGEIALNGNRIDLGVQQVESLRLSAIFEDRTVFLNTAHITLAPGETIRAGGNISLDNRFDLEIDSDDIHIHRIGLLADTGITGKMRIEAAGEGRLDDPALKGSLSLFDLAIRDNAMAPVDITFTLNDSVVEALFDDGFAVEASYRLDTGDFDCKGNFNETALDPFLHTADFPSLSGSLTGTLHAEGNISEPSRMSADLSIEALRILQEKREEAPVEMITVSGFSATLDDGAFSIPQNEILLLGANPLAVSGSGRTDGNFTFRAEGEIPLSTAALFYPALVDPEGNIDFSGSVSRTDGTPIINADIRLHDIGIAVPVLMQKISRTNGRIRVTGRTITVEDVAGRLDTGRFTAEGSIDLEESFRPGQTRLRVNAHALPIRIPEMLETTINGEMEFSGTPDKSKLSGQVVFLDGLYYRDVEINLIEEVTQRRRRGTAATRETADYDMPYLKNLSLDIDTSFRKPLMVDNNLALMTLRPEIRINGTLNRPSVTGRAEVDQGTVTYQNIEFDIARGVIDFVDPYRIQPDIDIRATADVRKWDILLEISGTPDDIRFKLTSNPPEEHADILSLLLLGKTTRELAEGTGPAGASPEEMLVNLLADRLEEDIRAGTGLDIVEVEYSNGDAHESDPSMRVKIGKELSRRLIVTYGVERKSGETFHQQTAIYRLLEFLSMSAFQDTGGTYGGEMQFRLEFR
ncbi:MAG: translocation/assembly module TamB domain-containing protein, partial [Thermodesulfobacteriota bacterium]